MPSTAPQSIPRDRTSTSDAASDTREGDSVHIRRGRHARGRKSAPRNETRHGWQDGLHQARERIEHGVTGAVGTPLSEIAARLNVKPMKVPRVFDGTTDLKVISDRVLAEVGLTTEFPPQVKQEVAGMHEAVPSPDARSVKDQRKLLACSIDNGTLDPQTLQLVKPSMDLDQLTVGERIDKDHIRIFVDVADVDGLVKQGSATDEYAMQNTRTVYTGSKIYPMLPERLSTDLTSLNEGKDRTAMVAEFVVDSSGNIKGDDVYRGFVHNYAKLAYDSVAGWMNGDKLVPPPITSVPGLADQLRLQDEAAQWIKKARFERGSLEFADREVKADVRNGVVLDLQVHSRNRATELIENLMVAANQVAARFLEKNNFPSIRRVVKKPEPRKWGRICELASRQGTTLPKEPDAKALNEFLQKMKTADPKRFPMLSLSVIKLIGRGEYVVHYPGEEAPDHFALAVPDYVHFTAPNRRGPDIIVHRLVKGVLDGKKWEDIYSRDELNTLAAHFTEREHEVDKAQRQVSKSEAAKYLIDSHSVGKTFTGIVTGATDKGTWVNVQLPPPVAGQAKPERAEIEGKIVRNAQNVQVGDEVRVKLVDCNIERGYIDFENERRPEHRAAS